MTISRRTFVKSSSAYAATAAFSTRVAAAPAAEAITPALIEAAKKEGKVVYYTSIDLAVAERIAKAFEAQYPGIAVRVERSGAERVFQRIGQEYSSRIFAVDVANSSDAAHFVAWKRDGWLAPYVPEDVAKFFSPEHRDPDGLFATCRVTLSVLGYNTNLVKAADAPKSFADLLDPKWKGKIVKSMSALSRVWLSSLGYNTSLVRPEDAPKSFADLLDPKWLGKMVKAHPAYSGTIMTATFQIARELGWGFFEKLAKQKIMQVQSSTDPPKKLALGERAVMADGNDYNLIQLKERGQPVEVVYPAEGTPFVTGPTAIFTAAPNPNAARLFQNWLHGREAQQLLVDFARQHSLHAQVTEKPGVRKLSEIKLMKDDAAGVEAQAEEIKARYAKIFGV